jgi:predicted Rossmann fold flavoprotein
MFNVPDASLHALAGIVAPNARLRAPREGLAKEGPVLITHWGLSGPAALKLSAWGARAFAAHDYKTEILVEWQRDSAAVITEQIMRHRDRSPARRLASSHVLDVPARLWEWLIRRAEVPLDRQWGRLSKVERDRLVQTCAACRLTMEGKSMYKDEFVTCGGVRLSEVDFKTMESKRRPGLYLAGELLDIDAVTGGFNFQAAWTTGWIAGRAMTGAAD